jgi:hypothetical protein
MQHILGVCPHDVTKDPEKWSAFARELHARGGPDCRFAPETCFERFATGFDSYALAYAHPLHAVKLWRTFQFMPLAAYKETFDEAVVIANKQVKSPTLQDLTLKQVACIHGSPSHAAHLIDFQLRAIAPTTRWVTRTSYQDVVMAVAQGEAQYGVVLKSVWDSMMTLRDRVRPFHATSLRQLVHVFMLAPAHRLRAPQILDVLTNLHKDAQGETILKRLGCSQLTAVDENQLGRIESALDSCGLRVAA